MSTHGCIGNPCSICGRTPEFTWHGTPVYVTDQSLPLNSDGLYVDTTTFNWQPWTSGGPIAWAPELRRPPFRHDVIPQIGWRERKQSC